MYRGNSEGLHFKEFDFDLGTSGSTAALLLTATAESPVFTMFFSITVGLKLIEENINSTNITSINEKKKKFQLQKYGIFMST